MTPLDFNEIKDLRVGYKQRKINQSAPTTLEILTFKDFIPPYSHEAPEYEDVVKNLQSTLDKNISQQDTVLDGAQNVNVGRLATATLQRE